MKTKKDRREFIRTGAASLAAVGLLGGPRAGIASFPSHDPFPELVEATIAELQSRMKSSKLSARRLTEMYLDRVREVDQKTRSVIEINPDALAIADKLDSERKKGRVRSMLHGIPVLIKDNIDTADKMMTTAGSLALVGAPTPKNDAFVVTQLRKSGAVILGKTNLSEWANFRGNRSISGWSGRGLQTNNPYFLDQNPCGSSSGSGVAVSANLAAVAVGTETNGSIICPAVTNGVVGIKPTLGLISRSGIIPIAHTQDTAGPMARTVADAAILLGAMVGHDTRDDITRDAKKGAKDYTKFLDADGLRGARLGLVTQFAPQQNSEKYRAYYQRFIDALRDAGAILIDVTFPGNQIATDRTNVLLYEFKTDLNRYLASRGAKYRSLEDLIKFNDENKEKELPLFGQELFIQAQAKGPLTEQAYLDSLAKIKKATRDDGVDALITQHKLDALVGPTVGPFWSIPAVAGYPSITVPAGLRENAPAGMLFAGRPFTEPHLIKYAYAFEQKTRGRVPPQFIAKKPTVAGAA